MEVLVHSGILLKQACAAALEVKSLQRFPVCLIIDRVRDGKSLRTVTGRRDNKELATLLKCSEVSSANRLASRWINSQIGTQGTNETH